MLGKDRMSVRMTLSISTSMSTRILVLNIILAESNFGSSLYLLFTGCSLQLPYRHCKYITFSVMNQTPAVQTQSAGLAYSDTGWGQPPFPCFEPDSSVDEIPVSKCYVCDKEQSEHADGQWCRSRGKWSVQESGAAACDYRSTRSQYGTKYWKGYYPNDPPAAPDALSFFFVGMCFGICIGVCLPKLRRS